MNDPFALLEDILRFYAQTPCDDGMRPAGPNPMLVADSGDRARRAIQVLAELELDYTRRNSDMLQIIRDVMHKPTLAWPGLSDQIGLYEQGDR